MDVDVSKLRETSQGGLRRLPAFIKTVFSTIREQQQFRDAANEPNLLNPEIRFNDVIYATIIGVVLFSFRFILQNRIIPTLFPKKTSKIHAKLTEDLYYTFYYIFAFGYFMLAILPNVEWGSRLWSNQVSVVHDLVYPFPPSLSTVERWYYIQAGGFYLSAWSFLILFDSRRSDFIQYVIHHAVTIGMLVMSYLYGYTRTGIVILALHDLGDIFLYSSKFCHHLKLHGIDIALFAMFAVSFYVTRLLFYSRIVHAIFVETLQILVTYPSFNQWAMFYDTYIPHYVFFSIALITLLVLHCFWYLLVLRLIANELFFGKKIIEEGDPRSDDEDEDEEEEKPLAHEGDDENDMYLPDVKKHN